MMTIAGDAPTRNFRILRNADGLTPGETRS
jgi:hypothetical protein